jgi:hypothetical protein
MSLLIKIYNKFFHKNVVSDKYETFILNTKPMSAKQKELLKNCKRQLIDNKIPLSKIRFVFEPSFTYDIDKNEINPIYKQLISKNRKLPTIEINAPRNIMTIYCGEYRVVDNYSILRSIVKKTKIGIVVLVSEIDYSHTIYIANLDDAVNHYNLIEENLNYNS